MESNPASEPASPSPSVETAAKPNPALETAKKVGVWLKPWADLAWLYLRIWAPFLANPLFRSQQAKYGAREYREAAVWHITLPNQCCQCGASEGIVNREFEKPIRNFETPAAIVSATLGVSVLLFLLGVLISSWFFNFFVMSLIALVGGSAFLFAKSWPETVRLHTAVCPAHADAIECPKLVANDEDLCVILASPEVAAAARADVVARLRAGKKYGGEDDAPARSPSPGTTRPTQAQPESRSTFKRPELPPIKLDD